MPVHLQHLYLVLQPQHRQLEGTQVVILMQRLLLEELYFVLELCSSSSLLSNGTSHVKLLTTTIRCKVLHRQRTVSYDKAIIILLGFNCVYLDFNWKYVFMWNIFIKYLCKISYYFVSIVKTDFFWFCFWPKDGA